VLPKGVLSAREYVANYTMLPTATTSTYNYKNLSEIRQDLSSLPISGSPTQAAKTQIFTLLMQPKVNTIFELNICIHIYVHTSMSTKYVNVRTILLRLVSKFSTQSLDYPKCPKGLLKMS